MLFSLQITHIFSFLAKSGLISSEKWVLSLYLVFWWIVCCLFPPFVKLFASWIFRSWRRSRSSLKNQWNKTLNTVYDTPFHLLFVLLWETPLLPPMVKLSISRHSASYSSANCDQSQHLRSTHRFNHSFKSFKTFDLSPLKRSRTRLILTGLGKLELVPNCFCWSWFTPLPFSYASLLNLCA